MNEGLFPEGPSGLLLGRAFIIVLVIVFSGLSFTLGYFVGKNTVDRQVASPLQAAEGTTQQNLPEPLSAPRVQKEEIARTGSSQYTVEEISAETVEPLDARDRQNRNRPAAVSSQQQELVTPSKNEGKVTSRSGSKKTSGASPQEAAADEKDRQYTVQIGAFNSAADANQLKVSFEKKGYKPYITSAKDEKGHNIYKVKTGEFKDKKNADVLALKLKKTEGLHAYVTTRAE